jgi:hypothetical protein
MKTTWLWIAGWLLAALAAAVPARGASHLWRFNEVFSSADGSVQFIEMVECGGATEETFIQNKWVLAVVANHKYTFRSNLTGNTAHKYLLLGTQAFADLPGAPQPDAIIPAGFLPVGGDTLEYWQYPDATWDYPALPLDGHTSIHVNVDDCGVQASGGTQAVNSPTNYAGETGSIDVTTPVRATSWGAVKRTWRP